MNFEQKYLKYKNKYLQLKKQSGGGDKFYFFVNYDDFLKLYSFITFKDRDLPLPIELNDCYINVNKYKLIPKTIKKSISDLKTHFTKGYISDPITMSSSIKLNFIGDKTKDINVEMHTIDDEINAVFSKIPDKQFNFFFSIEKGLTSTNKINNTLLFGFPTKYIDECTKLKLTNLNTLIENKKTILSNIKINIKSISDFFYYIQNVADKDMNYDDSLKKEKWISYFKINNDRITEINKELNVLIANIENEDIKTQVKNVTFYIKAEELIKDIIINEKTNKIIYNNSLKISQLI